MDQAEKVNERMTIRLSPEYVNSVTERAKRLGLTRSELVRIALDQAMEEPSPGQDVPICVELSPAEINYLDSIVKNGWFSGREKALRRMIDIFFEADQVKRLEERFRVMARSSGQEVALSVTENKQLIASR
ncbi:MAG: ribbon-helix-helix domain-containing protein [Methanobacteriota archaeon]